ncbi:MAG: glycosyltransferase family 39 protein, partial [Acidimicrobiales bacterium]
MSTFTALRPAPSPPKSFRPAPKRWRRERPAGPKTRDVAWGRFPAASLGMALGLLVIAIGYAGGRAALPWGDPVYWAGEVLMVAAVAWRLLSPRLAGDREALGIAVAFSAATYIVKVLYQPLIFAFPDELQHWRTAQDILATGQLFHVNQSLPVSPLYPGLEICSSALSSLAGLSTFVSGLVVAGIAHVLLTAAVYLLFRRVSGSARLAAIGAVVYAFEPHFQSFDSEFTYQLFGLVFLALAVLATERLTERRRAGWSWWICALAAIAMTVITHHVGSYALLLSLGLVSLAHLLRPEGKARDWRPAVLTGACAVMIGLWL